jgi:hypothetical protein
MRATVKYHPEENTVTRGDRIHKNIHTYKQTYICTYVHSHAHTHKRARTRTHTYIKSDVNFLTFQPKDIVDAKSTMYGANNYIFLVSWHSGYAPRIPFRELRKKGWFEKTKWRPLYFFMEKKTKHYTRFYTVKKYCYLWNSTNVLLKLYTCINSKINLVFIAQHLNQTNVQCPQKNITICPNHFPHTAHRMNNKIQTDITM